jgi:hypothetical protein
MTGWFVNDVLEVADHRCTRCGHHLAWVDEVGWVAARGNSYDMCEGDAYGNHLAEPLWPHPQSSAARPASSRATGTRNGEQLT